MNGWKKWKRIFNFTVASSHGRWVTWTRSQQNVVLWRMHRQKTAHTTAIVRLAEWREKSALNGRLGHGYAIIALCAIVIINLLNFIFRFSFSFNCAQRKMFYRFRCCCCCCFHSLNATTRNEQRKQKLCFVYNKIKSRWMEQLPSPPPPPPPPYDDNFDWNVMGVSDGKTLLSFDTNRKKILLFWVDAKMKLCFHWRRAHQCSALNKGDESMDGKMGNGTRVLFMAILMRFENVVGHKAHKYRNDGARSQCVCGCVSCVRAGTIISAKNMFFDVGMNDVNASPK